MAEKLNRHKRVEFRGRLNEWLEVQKQLEFVLDTAVASFKKDVLKSIPMWMVYYAGFMIHLKKHLDEDDVFPFVEELKEQGMLVFE